ncbi:DUF6616 family protein [Sphingomicrobium astaxanthinifaciens]|uniref:DUF6616 family protein n=1 Tax=Sphingomicrobium astaxanthinifaciens TaxID=1227949 RepID=UPI001FCB1F95|nr:DUF6616 family protein [Sphingomicrobium astaxanthinifaciens]MCJ7420523.1 hypothetical protein [Sphingomicrobium astaxanthinifaciens]
MLDLKWGDWETMYIYVELWKAKQKWLDMEHSDRKNYLSRVQESIGNLVSLGIEPLHFALLDKDVPHSVDYRYLAVWKMPDRRAAETLERDVEAAGFHDLFEQVNARGEETTPEGLFEDMAALKTTG